MTVMAVERAEASLDEEHRLYERRLLAAEIEDYIREHGEVRSANYRGLRDAVLRNGSDVSVRLFTQVLDGLRANKKVALYKVRRQEGISFCSKELVLW